MIDRVIVFIWKTPVILLCVGIAMAIFTFSKLYKMAQLNGWVGERQIVEAVVTEKKKQKVRKRFGISFTDYSLLWQRPRYAGQGTAMVVEKFWNETEVGESINLVRISNEDDFRSEYGIWISPGNVFFDLCLLSLWMFLIWSGGVRIIRNWSRKKRP